MGTAVEGASVPVRDLPDVVGSRVEAKIFFT